MPKTWDHLLDEIAKDAMHGQAVETLIAKVRLLQSTLTK